MLLGEIAPEANRKLRVGCAIYRPWSTGHKALYWLAVLINRHYFVIQTKPPLWLKTLLLCPRWLRNLIWPFPSMVETAPVLSQPNVSDTFASELMINQQARRPTVGKKNPNALDAPSEETGISSLPQSAPAREGSAVNTFMRNLFSLLAMQCVTILYEMPLQRAEILWLKLKNKKIFKSFF